MNDELITDVWNELKVYIPVKERFEAADKLVEIFDDHGLSDGLEAGIGFDRALKSAVRNRFDIEETDEEDDEYN